MLSAKYTKLKSYTHHVHSVHLPNNIQNIIHSPKIYYGLSMQYTVDLYTQEVQYNFILNTLHTHTHTTTSTHESKSQIASNLASCFFKINTREVLTGMDKPSVHCD